jgi:esterase
MSTTSLGWPAEVGAASVSTVADASINGVSLYYEEHGTGHPMLCIHGTGSSALIWGDAVAELARRGRVIVYDRRGCTRSERPDPYDITTVGQHADDAAGLLEALDAIPAVVIGRSYGGDVAVDLVQRYPDLVRALVLLEPAVFALSAETLAWGEMLTSQVQAAAAAGGPAAASDRLYRIVLGDAAWQGLPEAVRQMVVDNGPAVLAELTGGWSRPDPAVLARVRQPVLIVSAASSPAAFRSANDVLSGMIPGARHELIGGGHLLSPAARVVLDFLEDVLDKR